MWCKEGGNWVGRLHGFGFHVKYGDFRVTLLVNK